MTGTIASSGLTSLGPDKTMSNYAGSLSKDKTLSILNLLLNIKNLCVDDFKGAARSEYLPVMRSSIELIPIGGENRNETGQMHPQINALG